MESGEITAIIEKSNIFNIGIFLSGYQLDYHEVILLAILLSPDMSDKNIAEILNMSAANIRIWRKKFKVTGELKNG